MRIAVAGATNWGLTLACLLARNGLDVVALARTSDEASQADTRRGLARLPELRLPPAVSVATPESAGPFDALVVAVPAQSARQFVARIQHANHLPVISGAKGIEHGSGKRVSQVLAELGWSDISVLSGPTLAREILRDLPAAAVVASGNDTSAGAWQERFASPMFRTYRSTDVTGVEIAGAYKNVVAIASGATAGRSFGANTVAALMTRGLAEMTRLGIALGAQHTTFSGLAGVGDLAATCFSPLSRNYQLGERLATGEPPADALKHVGEVVEGAATAPVVLELGRQHGVELPIAEQVAAVMAGHATVDQAMHALLARSLKSESH